MYDYCKTGTSGWLNINLALDKYVRFPLHDERPGSPEPRPFPYYLSAFIKMSCGRTSCGVDGTTQGSRKANYIGTPSVAGQHGKWHSGDVRAELPH